MKTIDESKWEKMGIIAWQVEINGMDTCLSVTGDTRIRVNGSEKCQDAGMHCPEEQGNE